MKSNINLHIHTTYSDGKNTVAEIVDGLKNAGIKYFSITDHDYIYGNIEAAELAVKYDMKYINGVELSCCFDGEIGFDATYVCHIIGLAFNYEKMSEELKKISAAKDAKMTELFDELVKNGLKLDENNVYTNGRIPERITIGYELVNKGYAKDINEAFLNILNSDKYRKFAQYLPSIKQAIKIIQSCNGIAVWAHPFGYARGGKKDITYEQVEELAANILSYGIDAIEVYYQEYSIEKINYLEQLANKMNKLKSIATDYHGITQLWFEKDGLVVDEGIVKSVI